VIFAALEGALCSVFFDRSDLFRWRAVFELK